MTNYEQDGSEGARGRGPRERGARNSLPRSILRFPFVVLVGLYFLLDDVVLAAIRPLVRRMAELRLVTRFVAWIETLSPYTTLALFAVPFVILEPPKIFSLYLIGTGHFRTGLIMLATAHLLSIVLVERLFHVAKPQLMRIDWFAWSFAQAMRLRDWALGHLEAMGVNAVWRDLVAGLRAAVARSKAILGTMVRPARRALLRARLWFARADEK